MKVKITQQLELPKLVFSLEAWVKMNALVKEFEKEVGWLASMSYDEDNHTWTVKNVFVPEQTVTGTETDIKAEAIQKLSEQLLKEGKEEDADNLLLWGHSHVNMPTTPSSTDVDTFFDMYQYGPDIFVMLIMNKKGSVHCEVYFDGLLFEDYPFAVDYGVDTKDFIESAKKQAKKPRVTVPKYGNGGYTTGKPVTPIAGGKSNFQDGMDLFDDFDYEEEIPSLNELEQLGFKPQHGYPTSYQKMNKFEQDFFDDWCKTWNKKPTPNNIKLFYTLYDNNLYDYL